jgi:large subunit ribosomal protein L23
VEIRRAVEALFKTKVLEVKTQNIRGKTRRMGRTQGKKPDWKKAVVKLAPGQSIDFFEGT